MGIEIDKYFRISSVNHNKKMFSCFLITFIIIMRFDCNYGGKMCTRCSFTYCPSTTIQIQLENTYDNEDSNREFDIFDPTEVSLYYGSIRKGENSSFQIGFDGPCAPFSLVAYCGADYGISCSSSFVINGVTPVSTRVPTVRVTAAPSTGQPSQSITCPFYNGFNTSFASRNYSVCTFSACGKVSVSAQNVSSVQQLWARLYDSSGYAVGSGINFDYTHEVELENLSGGCHTFTLHQGCVDEDWTKPGQSFSCSGNYVISGVGVVAAPSLMPSIAPSINPAIVPNDAVSPSEQPSPAPIFSTSSNCGGYTVLNPLRKSALCYFSSCGGTQLFFESYLFHHMGYYTHFELKLYASSGRKVMDESIYSSGRKFFEFTTPITSICQVYTLKRVCSYAPDTSEGECGGYLDIYGGTPVEAPTVLPTEEPSLVPTSSDHAICNFGSVEIDPPIPWVCYFDACPGEKLSIEVRNFTGEYVTILTIRDVLYLQEVTSDFPPFAFTIPTWRYSQCHTFSLLADEFRILCESLDRSNCGAEIRVYGGRNLPSGTPTTHPSGPSYSPSIVPTVLPTTLIPTVLPTTIVPTVLPTTIVPTVLPTSTPTEFPTSSRPTRKPTAPTMEPTTSYLSCPVVSRTKINCYFSACANTLIIIDSNETNRNCDWLNRKCFTKRLYGGALLSDELFYSSEDIRIKFRTSKTSACQTYRLEIEPGSAANFPKPIQYLVYGGASLIPTSSPSIFSLSSSILCAFSPSSHDYCSFTACPSTRISVQLLNDSSIKPKQTFSIYNPNGDIYVTAVILKGENVSYTFKYDGQCTLFALVADSFGSYIINGVYPSSSRVPTLQPTNPPMIPITQPVVSTFTCDPYQNFSICSFYTCGGQALTVQLSPPPPGNPYFYGRAYYYAELYDESGFKDGIYHFLQGGCQTLSLHQRCEMELYDTCLSFVISGVGIVAAPSLMPSIAPSINPATLSPSDAVSPTMEPSGPSPAPSFSTSVDCGYVELQYSSQNCYFTACGGTHLRIADNSNYYLLELYLYDSNDFRIIYYPARNYYKYAYEFTTPWESACQTYKLVQSSGAGYGIHPGHFIIFGGSPVATIPPTAAPSGPSIVPTRAPSKQTYFCEPFYIGRNHHLEGFTENSTTCYFSACPGTRLFFEVVNKFNGFYSIWTRPILKLQNSIGETVASDSDFYYPITITSGMYSQCQAFKLLINCFFSFGVGECGGTVRIDGGLPPVTSSPTARPTMAPTILPSTETPSILPTNFPTAFPTTDMPTTFPTTDKPSILPSTAMPTESPTTDIPTIKPTTHMPTELPTTEVPTTTDAPSLSPSTEIPSGSPTTDIPTVSPSTYVPTESPTTEVPTVPPTTVKPTALPSTDLPTYGPTCSPTHALPTVFPTVLPTCRPTADPSIISTTNLPSAVSSCVPSTYPSHVPSIIPTSSKPTRAPFSSSTLDASIMPSAAPSSLPLTHMEQSIVLENIVLSSLTSEAITTLQSSVRTAVANVSSIPVSYISIPVLSSPSPKSSAVAEVTPKTEIVPHLQKRKLAAKSAKGIVASYSIIGLSSAIFSALNVSMKDSKNGSVLASICSSRLNVNNGSVLLGAIRAQVSSNNNGGNSLLSSLLSNATVSKVTVTVIPVAPPSTSPVTVGIAPSFPPSNSASSSSGGPDLVGLYVGIAVAIFTVIVLAIAVIHFLSKKPSASVYQVHSFPTEATASPNQAIVLDSNSDGGAV